MSMRMSSDQKAWRNVKYFETPSGAQGLRPGAGSARKRWRPSTLTWLELIGADVLAASPISSRYCTAGTFPCACMPSTSSSCRDAIFAIYRSSSSEPDLGHCCHAQGQPPARAHCLAECARRGLEGIVAKRKDSAYRSGPRPGWIKVKGRRQDACSSEREYVQGAA